MRGSFNPGYLEGLAWSAGTVRSIRQLGEHKGKQQLFERQSPQMLHAMREVATVQSIESSNRIEGVLALPGRIAEIVGHETTPRNRPEQEIAGYRDVLATIHANARGMVLTPSLILQLHRDLLRFAPSSGGIWKDSPNDIVDVMPDGAHRLRFSPVSPHVVDVAIKDAADGYRTAIEAGVVDPVIIVPAFVLDFLCIHPFCDGNGRVSRLLNLMLLYQTGYDVGRYISLEKIVEESKETYYEALEASSAGWHDGEHDIRPWLDHCLGVLLAAYREFEDRVGHMRSGRGAKREMVIERIRRLPSAFRYGDIERGCPGISRPTIVRALGELRDKGEIRCTKGGRDATWEKAAT
ncbi:MAG: Fic family protein [Coriobacteriia bacterium]